MQKGGGTERQQAEQAMSKANVVYEGGASPGGEDAKGIALVDTWASPRDAGGWWMCCCCLDDNTKGGGMDLGVATCPYHPFNCAELQSLNRLCYQGAKSKWSLNSELSDTLKHHMESAISTAKERLMEVAQRSGLIASYNNLENLWSLADDKNAAAKSHYRGG